MTYTEEFIPDQGAESTDTASYPSAFGITFTPKVGGIILAVLGLAGAAYLMLNLVQPLWEERQKLDTDLSTKQTDIQQKQAKLKSIAAIQAKLEQAKQQRKEVLALFSTDRTLDTWLLDVNRFIQARQGKLTKFTPEQPTANAADPTNTTNTNIINDGSLGPELNGKLKRKIVNVELEGSFDQIQSIMRSIERLQQLMIVKDFKADLDKSTQRIVVDQQGRVLPVGQAITTIKTSFKLHALTPLAPEEAATATAAPPKK